MMSYTFFKMTAPNLKDLFEAYAKFGNSQSKGDVITLKQCDKWMTQAGVIDNKKITTTDTSITYAKMKAPKGLTYKEFNAYLDELAAYKKVDAAEMKAKLAAAGIPGVANTTAASQSAVVTRMTDTSKYGGTAKERFDESGKGTGIRDKQEQAQGNSGYVQGYKNEGTYDKSHNK